nr:LTA synthase family protein [Collinsella urealyticum]
MPLDSYYRQGFLPTFISSAQRLVPAKPAGYRRRSAEDLLERYARVYDESPALGAHPARARAATRFQELKPSVICIMNESFADLSIFDGLRCGYTGPKRFLDLPDALMSGVSYMSAFGAGTCNSEFEFLTGNTMAFLGAGSYPYLNYNLAPVENLARHFKNQGYRTVAMHPNHGSNWNRVNVFEDLGFDSFLTIKDFPGAPELCHKVTDAATYDACLRELETSKDPVFIHDVTMEGHAGYDTGLVPPEQRVNIRPQGVDFDHVTWADEYLALNEDSDKALDSLLARLKLMERPVVVVMYGDHQPFFTDAMNDAYFPGEDPAVHVERLYQTRYLVWANFDLEEAGLPEYPRDLDLDISSLGAMLMHRIGAPMSEYQKARLALRAELPVINVVGRQDADGTWRLPEQAGSSDDARQDYEFMQHRILFDHGGKVLATRHQAEANRLETHEGA